MRCPIYLSHSACNVHEPSVADPDRNPSPTTPPSTHVPGKSPRSLQQSRLTAVAGFCMYLLSGVSVVNFPPSLIGGNLVRRPLVSSIRHVSAPVLPLTPCLLGCCRKFGKQIQKRQLEVPEYAASFVNYKALKKVRHSSCLGMLSCFRFPALTWTAHQKTVGHSCSAVSE